MRSQDSVGCRAVGNVTDALRAKGMWDNLLILSTSDNGGPVYKGNGCARPIRLAHTVTEQRRVLWPNGG